MKAHEEMKGEIWAAKRMDSTEKENQHYRERKTGLCADRKRWSMETRKKRQSVPKESLPEKQRQPC